MKALIVNLQDCEERRDAIKKQMEALRSIDYEFIDAVDGRKMNTQELNQLFNLKRFKSLYFREARPGEVGCTMSHQRCFQAIIDQNLPYALLLEDDAVLGDVNRIIHSIHTVQNWLDKQELPTVILFSSWFWHCEDVINIDDIRIVKVFDAFFTYAYVINRKAVLLMKEERPFVTADDWFYWRKKGIQILGVTPFVINHPTDESVESTISGASSKRTTVNQMLYRITHFKRLFIRKWLESKGNYEKFKPIAHDLL